MMEQSKQPKSPVTKERAMNHALLATRRSWAGRTADFEGWGGYELDPDPLVIHDLDGRELFYEFTATEKGVPIQTVKTSASKILGAPVIAVELGPRCWDPVDADRSARRLVQERFPGAEITASEFVCYSYPKIGVRVFFGDRSAAAKQVILDVADLSVVDRFGADELEGFTSWSFYGEIPEGRAEANESRWELMDAELEAQLSASPRILDKAFTIEEAERLRPTFAPEAPPPIPVIQSRILQYSLRCPSHDCFALYAQQTNVYCAVATGQMILDFYRYYYSQDEIAAAMGTGSSGTGNNGQAAGYQKLSNNCMIATIDLTAAWAEAKQEIDANRPLKSGINGHARACAGWQKQNVFLVGQKPKYWLRIYDPWPWNANICQGGRIVWEDWDAIEHTNFIYVRHRTTPCP